VLTSPVFPYCHTSTGFTTRVTGLATYTVPKIDVLVSGRVLVNLIEPGTVYGDRLNEVDFRIAKLLRFGRTRTNVGVDIYSLFNANPALTYNAASSTALPFPRPTGVLTPRFANSAQIDF